MDKAIKMLHRKTAAICVSMLLLTLSVFIFKYLYSPSTTHFSFTDNINLGESRIRCPSEITKTDNVNNTGAISFLKKYEHLFNSDGGVNVLPDPNFPETVTKWWHAAALIDWYLNSPIRHKCKNMMSMGNWHICQDKPYIVKPPCLVYSFGINWDFTFDDAMTHLGCEVHSFDPSMKEKDHRRENGSLFHNLGLGSINTDAFIPRSDIYVKEPQTWKLRTVNAIRKELGHENRVIDVFKMDIEGHEWAVIDNMMETGVFKYVRQFLLEYHMFHNFPLKKDYVNIYKIQTRLREMGFREFFLGPHPKTLTVDKFNNQGDCEYVNAFFDSCG